MSPGCLDLSGGDTGTAARSTHAPGMRPGIFTHLRGANVGAVEADGVDVRYARRNGVVPRRRDPVVHGRLPGRLR